MVRLSFVTSLRFTLLLIVLLCLVGCTSSQNMFNSRMFDSLNNQVGELFISEEKVVIDEKELADLAEAPQVTLLWENSVGEGEVAVFSPASKNGAVYAAAEDGQLVRFDAATGEQVWKIDTEHKLSGGVGAGDDLILVGTFTGEVLAFNETGSSVWKAKVTSEVLSPPQTMQDVVVVRSGDGRIFGLDAIDGSRKWVYQGATPALTVRSAAGISISRGALFAGFAGGKMVAMSLFNGNIGWEAAVSQPRGVTELERMTDIASLPVVDEQLVCAVAYQGRVGCFSIADGSQIWAREASSSAGLSMDSDYVYVSEDKGVVAAYDRKSGAGMWKQGKLGSKKLSAPLVRDQYIVVGDDQGNITLLRNYDGAVMARAATDESAIIATPINLQDGFLVQTMNGGLYTFSTEF